MSSLYKSKLYYPYILAGFSSQYGAEDGLVYTVKNLLGESNIYPRYGDFCEACVLRTYGCWWNHLSSTPAIVGRRFIPSGYCTQEFVDVIYKGFINLESIHIYETFIPGCVIIIFALDSRKARKLGQSASWVLLWQRSGPSREDHRSRVFAPDLNIPKDFATNRVRVEFNIDLADYYTELDTIGIKGMLCDQTLTKQMEDLNLEDSDEEVGPSGDSNKKSDDARLLQIRNSFIQLDPNETFSDSSAGLFSSFPNEITLHILQMLDARTLFSLSRASKFFYNFCADPILYTSLTLKPYCLRVCDSTLMSLEARCSRLTELDFSWCGADDAVTESAFLSFISECGSKLRILRLASCPFISDGCLKAVSKQCPDLIELDLSGCKGGRITRRGFLSLTRLTKLERLNLYRSSVDMVSLVSILRANANLRHLCLGSCSELHNCDDLATALAQHCPELLSVDLWRCRSFSGAGLRILADGCPQLEELDLGWCSELNAKDGCIVYLASRCKNLKKLFLTANRTVGDSDLVSVALNCPQLKQFDILGTNYVTVDGVLLVLKSCPKLEMFDVSFCSSIKKDSVTSWRATFPHCSIQMSFQSTLEN